MNPFDELVKAHQSQSVDQQFGQVFNQLGQYTSGLSTPFTGMNIAQTQQQQSASKSGFQQLFDKAKNVVAQTGNILGQGISASANFVKHSAQDIYNSTIGTAQTLVDLPTYTARSIQNENRSKELRAKLTGLSGEYRAGRMSKTDYQKALTDTRKALADVNKSAQQIESSRSVGERSKDIINSTINILSLGSLSLAEVGGKQAIQAGSKEAVNALLDQGATSLEKLVMHVPAVRSLVARNLASMAEREGQVAAGETAFQVLSRNGRKVAADLLIKRPVFYQSNVGQARSLYEHLLQGEYKGALTDSAWLGMQMLDGGPLGAASKLAGWSKTTLGKLSYGKGSFIDTVSKQIGDGNTTQIARFIEKAKQEGHPEAKDIEKLFRIAQESNLRVTGDNVDQAAYNFLRTYVDTGVDMKTVTPEKIYQDFKNWHEADVLWNAAAKSGELKMGVAEASRYTPVRWDATVRDSVAKIIQNAGDDPQARVNALKDLADNPTSGFSANSNLMLLLERAITEAPDAQAAAKAVQAIDAAKTIPAYLPKKLSNAIAKLGYTIAEPVGGRRNAFIEDANDTRKLVSSAIKGDGELFDPTASPQPVLHFFASLFQKAGVSPQESSQFATRALSQSVADNLQKTIAGRELGFNVTGDLANGGNAVLSRLQAYIENKPGIRGLDRISAGKNSIGDIRQLTISEIQEALGSPNKNGHIQRLSADMAKEVRTAIVKGYQAVPLDVRGLGDKITDTLYSANPLQKYYGRIQSAMRYTYNPFFRLQESAETKILSHVTASNLIWMKSRQQLDEAAKVLQDNRILSGILPGEAANDQVLGRITANLTKGQKRDLAGLALDIAAKQGKPLDELAKQNPEVLDDALRVIVQYSRKGALSSPLARTMNLAFFPMRYNAKVTQIAAEALAKQPPAIQKAVLHSMFSMKNYFQSEEGIKWQAAHSDAIQLFKWITPVNSIEATLNLLTHKPNSFGDLGQLGGLPLGIITQMLDGQGIINLNRPYVEPSSGKVFPKYVPETAKARAATALADLLNTMFTYPGRVLGLPGKSQTIRDVVALGLKTNKNEFNVVNQNDRLTPLQEQWVHVLQGNTSQEDIDKLYQSPASGQFNWYTLPPNTLPFNPTFDASSQYKAPKTRRKTIAPTVKTPL